MHTLPKLGDRSGLYNLEGAKQEVQQVKDEPKSNDLKTENFHPLGK